MTVEQKYLYMITTCKFEKSRMVIVVCSSCLALLDHLSTKFLTGYCGSPAAGAVVAAPMQGLCDAYSESLPGNCLTVLVRAARDKRQNRLA